MVFRSTETPMDRFNRNYIETSCGCWIWIKSCGIKGAGGRRYASFSDETVRKRRAIAAHRWIYAQIHGPIPKGLVVCHTCDNPECVNPAHLWLGTIKENSHDMVKKRRQPLHWLKPVDSALIPRKQRAANVRFTEEQVREVRRLSAEGVAHNEIARRFGTSGTWVGQVVHRRTWKHI